MSAITARSIRRWQERFKGRPKRPRDPRLRTLLVTVPNRHTGPRTYETWLHPTKGWRKRYVPKREAMLL